MRRKGSLIRIDAIREVRNSLATFGGGVVGKLDTRRPSPADGEPVFTYQVVFDAQSSIERAELLIQIAEITGQ